MLFPNMNRVRQWNDYYCGPAVLEMLVSMYGISLRQDQIVFAANAQHKIRTHGTLVSDLSLALSQLAPDYRLWFKQDSSISDLSTLINTSQLPVGVEWQGMFEDDDEDEEEEEENDIGDDDPGHYGIITGIDTVENWVTMADPYHNNGVDRQLTVLEFERRWWDINEIVNDKGQRQQVDDYHVMFVVVPLSTTTPELVGMTPL